MKPRKPDPKGKTNHQSGCDLWVRGRECSCPYGNPPKPKPFVIYCWATEPDIGISCQKKHGHKGLHYGTYVTEHGVAWGRADNAKAKITKRR